MIQARIFALLCLAACSDVEARPIKKLRREPLAFVSQGYVSTESAAYTAANGIYAEAADHVDYECDDEDKVTIGGWFRRESDDDTDEGLIEKANLSGQSYMMTTIQGSSSMFLSFAIGSIGNYCRTPFDIEFEQDWYFFLGTYDGAAGGTNELKADIYWGRAGIEPTAFQACNTIGTAMPTAIPNTANPLSIGRINGLSPSADFGIGWIDEIFVACTGKISASMLTCLARNGKPNSPIACGLPELRGWWRMGEGDTLGSGVTITNQANMGSAMVITGAMTESTTVLP